MARPLLAVITRALPSETLFEDRLSDLSLRDRAAVLDHLDLLMPGFDVVIALPDAEKMARGLARMRGTPVVVAQPDGTASPETEDEHPNAESAELPDEEVNHWSLPTPDPLPEDIRTAVILTRQLQDGLPELLVALLAAKRGWTVRAVAAVVERTNFRGRTRLELQGMAVHAALQIADTPRGLELERRFPNPE
ncbi:hypothetical protein [Deinococcus marmoris]|uniref:hypothetical protein n=1 Tax=Deinococcus marmoris TaxID=249408 RepID=UPI0004986AD2|nr:hypothetical protein [Deinococcus marmoris]